MAALSVRNLPEEVRREPRLHAARRGRSLEAEARGMLTETCRPGCAAQEIVAELQAWIDASYGSSRPMGLWIS